MPRNIPRPGSTVSMGSKVPLLLASLQKEGWCLWGNRRRSACPDIVLHAALRPVVIAHVAAPA